MKTQSEASKIFIETRKGLGLSQQQFARLLNVSRFVITNIEINRTDPSSDLLLSVLALKKKRENLKIREWRLKNDFA